MYTLKNAAYEAITKQDQMISLESLKRNSVSTKHYITVNDDDPLTKLRKSTLYKDIVLHGLYNLS